MTHILNYYCDKNVRFVIYLNYFEETQKCLQQETCYILKEFKKKISFKVVVQHTI